MASYEIVDHAVEGNGERHFFRVAVWRGARRGKPDLHAEFLLHPGHPIRNPLGNMIGIIETRVAQIEADPSITHDGFADYEHARFACRAPDLKSVHETHVAMHMLGHRGKVDHG